MVLYDLSAQIESNTCSFFCGLGGEEGVEYLADAFLLNAGAVVVYLHDVVTVGDGGRKRDFRQEGCLLGFFHYGINGIFQQAHDSLAQQGWVAMQRHSFGGQCEHRAEVVLLLLFGEITVEHLLALLQHWQQIHIRIASRPVFQHIFHRLQYTGGVLAVLFYVLVVFPQHAEHILRVVVVILVDAVLVEFNDFPEVFQQVVRHL